MDLASIRSVIERECNGNPKVILLSRYSTRDGPNVIRLVVQFSNGLRRTLERKIEAGENVELAALQLALVAKDESMSTEVKGVTDVVSEVKKLGARATQSAAGMRKSIAEVNDALDIVENISSTLRDAGAELRGALGGITNNPPAEDKPA